jgi:hypothetical protein
MMFRVNYYNVNWTRVLKVMTRLNVDAVCALLNSGIAPRAAMVPSYPDGGAQCRVLTKRE